MSKVKIFALMFGLLFVTGCETISTGEKFIGYRKVVGGTYITNVYKDANRIKTKQDADDKSENSQGGALEGAVSPKDSLNGNDIPLN